MNVRRHQRPEPAFVAVGPVPVSSALSTGLVRQARAAVPAYGAATAALASSQAFCVLPRLIGICSAPSSNRWTTRRGNRQTTVRYAISAVSCGPNWPDDLVRQRPASCARTPDTHGDGSDIR